MTSPSNIQRGLEDLLSDLHLARKNEQIGRLALLTYCDVKRWARLAGKSEVAEMALQMFAKKPSPSRDDFLRDIDQILESLRWHDESGQHRHSLQTRTSQDPCSAATRH